MQLTLGIDTGGTYTDSVLIDTQHMQVVAKSKALTTPEDLSRGIAASIDGLGFLPASSLAMVCLSTTLATNAIVEGRGGRVGLILAGRAAEGPLPTDKVNVVSGRCDIYGRIIESPNFDEIDRAVAICRGAVDAMAISAYASVRNPALEIAIREHVERQWDIPIVCAHELIQSLGFHNRTTTTVLNARLIPLIHELIGAVANVMAQSGIRAPLMIVRGDGTLMSSTHAMRKPIDTILSGPAASVIGATFLSKTDDAIVIDMGGTTTDIAHVADGRVRVRSDGARIGDWTTQVRAAEVRTTGLGGDSRIRLDSARRLHLGPQKSIPVALAATRHPAFADELRAILDDPAKPYLTFQRHDAEGYALAGRPGERILTDIEKTILATLRDGPRTLWSLASRLQRTDLSPVLGALVQYGHLLRISLTPTDFLHLEGSFAPYDRRAAETGIRLMAEQAGKTIEQFSENFRQAFETDLWAACIAAACHFDGQDFDIRKDPAARYFTEAKVDRSQMLLDVHLRLSRPIVAVGAPAAHWKTDLAQRLGTPVLAPENGEVANAIGAAVAIHSGKAEILIRPETATGRFITFTRFSRMVFDTLEQATTYAEEVGRSECLALVEAVATDMQLNISDTNHETVFEGMPAFVERRVMVTARASGGSLRP